MKIERNFNKQFQRWFPFSTLYIAEMFETDVEFFGTFPVSYLGLYEVLSNDSGTNHSIDGIIKNSKGEEIRKILPLLNSLLTPA